MKTNNRLSKDNNTHEPKVRPMVKETITEHKYMNCETKEICWFDLSTGPKWFETTHYPVNDETRTREYERPMNNTEYIEYLEKEVNERTIVARNLMGNSLSLQRENQELKEQVNSNAEIATKAIDRVNQLEKPIQFGTLATMSFTEHNKETLYTQAYVDKQQDQFLKAVESVLKEHGIISTSAKYIICSCLLKFDDSSFYKEHIYQEIKSAIEKGKE